MVAVYYWPVGDFHDGTTRVLGGYIPGFLTWSEAQEVIDQILKQQLKPHHVSYRVAEYENLKALYSDDIKI